MNVVLKIEALASAPDSIMIPVGRDLTPLEFLVVGQTEDMLQIVAECPMCATGVIEHDLPLKDISAPWGPALCDFCDSLPLDLEAEKMAAGAFPPPVMEVQIHPAIPTSLPAPASEARLPLTCECKHEPSAARPASPKLEIVDPLAYRPPHPPRPTSTCNLCGRYMAEHPDGMQNKTCGTCRWAKEAAKPGHKCRECNESLAGSHPTRVYCEGCSRGRSKTGQRRKVKSAKANRAERLCTNCGDPIGAVNGRKYCGPCGVEMAAIKQREANIRCKVKKMAREESGTEAAMHIIQSAECAESGIPLRSLTTFETSSPSNPLNVVNP